MLDVRTNRIGHAETLRRRLANVPLLRTVPDNHRTNCHYILVTIIVFCLMCDVYMLVAAAER